MRRPLERLLQSKLKHNDMFLLWHAFAVVQGGWVLVDNVSIPTFVLTLSHAKICPANVLHMS